MEIIENFLFQNGNKLTITFKNRIAVEIKAITNIDKNDLKAVLTNIFVPFYCEEFVSIIIYGPSGDMTKSFTDRKRITASELVDILVKVKSLALQD